MATDFYQPYTLYLSHQSCATFDLTNTPRKRLPVTILSLYPLKKASVRKCVHGRHDQDALGWIQEVAAQGNLHHQVVKITTDSLEDSARPSAIPIQGMGDVGVGLPQFSDEGEDNQPILHHCWCILMGHSLLTLEEVTSTISHPDHQCDPVAVAVQ